MSSSDEPTLTPGTPERQPSLPSSAIERHFLKTLVGLEQPTEVGPYKIRQPLGEGGMGAVYLAEQTSPVRRTVALKLIKPGMDSKEVIGRFEAERQALAMMSHPSIARVLDAGADDHGRPYFVMEYVAGEPICDYCDKHNLTMRQRLELFAPVCDAVQHAHTKGIIHRDLKPSNVLVSVRDGKPLPVIIDFGVAKALNHRLTERSVFTHFGMIIGTPEYMSPEQAEMTALDVDTRSDVYSLGVLLYELLAGALPFDPRTLRSAGYNEIQRIIREVDPPKPSTRLSSLEAKDAAAIARHRRETIEQLAGELRSELEWIPLKAMRKDRTERYRTAAEMGDDVRNYLLRKPLIAGPESVRYRLRKFLRRNGRSVVWSTTAIGLVLATVIVATVQVLHERQRRVKALANSNAILMDATDAASRTFHQLANDDLLRQEGLHLLRQSVLDRAVAFYQKIITLYPNDLQRARELGQLDNELGDAQTTSGDLADASQSLQESLRIRRQILSSIGTLNFNAQMDLAATLNNLSVLAIKEQRLSEAQRFYTESSAILQKMAQTQRSNAQLELDLAQLLSNIGSLSRQMGQPHKAAQYYQEALSIRRPVVDANPANIRARTDLATSYNDLALLSEDQGDLKQAAEDYRLAVDLRRQLAADQPAKTDAQTDYAQTLGLLAELESRQAQPSAQDDIKTALRAWEAIMANPQHRGVNPARALAYTEISWYDLLLGQPKAALYAAKRAVEEEPSSGPAQANLAHALLFLGDFEQAKSVYLKNRSVDMGDGNSFAASVANDFVALKRLGHEPPRADEILAALAPTTQPDRH